jgi:hypothetical protein
MEERAKKTMEDYYMQYPILAILIPTVGGFIAWKLSGVIWIGLAIMIFGLVSNYFRFLRKIK